MDYLLQRKFSSEITDKRDTFGSTFLNSLLNKVLKHGFLPFNSSKVMNFQAFGDTLMTDA